MKNWSGNIQWTPSYFYQPSTESVMIDLVKDALKNKKKIRMIGSGHSFTPLAKTNDYLLSLDNYQGITDIDRATNQVTVKAGTKLFHLNQLLDKESLALENMGDIDVQSVAGAISTGTHGTGTAFGNLSTQVTALRFINGNGEVVHCSETENPELFKAAQVSLGALGIIIEVTLQCVPNYCLELMVNRRELKEVVANLFHYNNSCRNFELYWFPNTPYAMTKELRLSDKDPDRSGIGDYFQDIILENYGLKLVCELSRLFPAMTNRLSSFSAKTITPVKKIKKSHEVFSTSRLVIFNEMEYNISAEAYPEVMKELVNWVNKNNQEVLFPIENRFVQKDDIYLSPAYERDSAYIAVHVYHKKNYYDYFQSIEDIFKAHGGRPHWGKIHTLTAKELATRYPKFDKFRKIRDQQDPHGIFLSPYLQSILEYGL